MNKRTNLEKPITFSRYNISISWIDIILFVLSGWLALLGITIIGSNQDQLSIIALANEELFKASICLFIVCSLRIAIRINKDLILKLSIWGIIFFCFFESYLAIFQLIDGFIRRVPISLTGSFFNSGLLGGSFAISLCILIPYYETVTNKNEKRLLSICIGIVVLLFPSIFSRAALLSFGCSIFIFYLKKPRKRIFLKRYKWMIVIFVLVVSCILYMVKKTSADGRVFIDKLDLITICRNDIKGAGLGHYLREHANTQTDYFFKKMDDGVNSKENTFFDNQNYTQLVRSVLMNKEFLNDKSFKAKRDVADVTGYTTNEFLKIGVECGIIGLLLFVLLCFFSIISLMKANSLWSYGHICLLIFCLFSYPFASYFFVALLGGFFAWASSEFKPLFCSRRTTVIWLVFLIVLSIPVLNGLSTFCRQQKGNKEYNQLHYYYEAEMYEYISEEFEHLYDDMKGNYRFLYDYGRSLSKIGEFEKSDSILKEGFAISTEPMFLNQMGMNKEAQGKFEEAEELYAHAFVLLPNRLYPLFLLGNLYAKYDESMIDIVSEAINTFQPKIESIRTNSMRTQFNKMIEERTNHN